MFSLSFLPEYCDYFTVELWGPSKKIKYLNNVHLTCCSSYSLSLLQNTITMKEMHCFLDKAILSTQPLPPPSVQEVFPKVHPNLKISCPFVPLRTSGYFVLK